MLVRKFSLRKTVGLFTKEQILTLSWFESLILPFVNAKFFQIKLSNQAFETRKKRAFWIVIRQESMILPFVNAKLFRNVIRACAFWKYALKPCMGPGNFSFVLRGLHIQFFEKISGAAFWTFGGYFFHFRGLLFSGATFFYFGGYFSTYY